MEIKSIKACIITIGDELLIGQTLNTNSHWIAQALTNVNIDVQYHLSIPDTAQAIVETLDFYTSKVDIIIITGGLGPTNDDVTKYALCEYFGDKLVQHPTILAHIQQLLQEKGLSMLPANIQQADLPAQATILFNRLGTAAGMLFNQENKWIVALPGVPFEMKTIVQEELLPRLVQHFQSPAIIHEYITTVGIPESRLAERIKDIEQGLPSAIKLAYLPSYGMVRLRLSTSIRMDGSIRSVIALFAQMIVDRLGTAVIDRSDADLPQVLYRLAQQHRLTIATAESCTGGGVASAILDVPGASAIFHGGIVAYHNDVKGDALSVSAEILSTHGAVSEKVVQEMATNCRLQMKVDVAIGISGILGPNSDNSNKPVGLVYMAIATHQDVQVFKHQFYGDRHTNKARTIALALIHLIQVINKQVAVD